MQVRFWQVESAAHKLLQVPRVSVASADSSLLLRQRNRFSCKREAKANFRRPLEGIQEKKRQASLQAGKLITLPSQIVHYSG
jgi:hypothetical protein